MRRALAGLDFKRVPRSIDKVRIITLMWSELVCDSFYEREIVRRYSVLLGPLSLTLDRWHATLLLLWHPNTHV